MAGPRRRPRWDLTPMLDFSYVHLDMDKRMVSGKLRDYEKERSQQAAKRHARRRALHEIVGTRCECGAPATDLVDPHFSPTEAGRRDLHRGPADRGLSSRPELILASATRRVAMCHPCQVAFLAKRLTSRARDGLRPSQDSSSPVLDQGEATTGPPAPSLSRRAS